MKEQPDSCDICILCALYEEADAVLTIFKRYAHASFKEVFYGMNRYRYLYTTIQNNRKEPLTVMVTWPPDKGPTNTAQEARLLAQQFHPRFMAMTGLCAGDPRKVHLGDLVVARATYFPEAGKITSEPDGHQPEGETFGPDPQVLQYAQGFDSWEKPVTRMKRQHCKRSGEDFERPERIITLMASGAAVHMDDPFPRLQQHHRDTHALDMEAASFYSALRPSTRSLVVKGVSDYADINKNTKTEYRELAARASAVYILRFIQEYVTEETMPRHEQTTRSFAHDEQREEQISTTQPIQQEPDPFDSTPCVEASLNVLDEERVRKFRTQKKIQQLRDARINLDAFGEPRGLAFLHQSPPTYATLLCFGKEPYSIVRGAYTRCTCWKGVVRGNVLEPDIEHKANLLKQYEENCSFLRRNLRLKRVIDKNTSTEE